MLSSSKSVSIFLRSTRALDTLLPMNIRDFKQLKNLKSQGYLHFRSYVMAEGLLRRIGITLLLHISFRKWSNYIPIVSGLAKSVQGLLIGFLVEAETSELLRPKALGSQPIYQSNVATINSCSNDLYDYIVIGSGPGAAIAAQKLDSRHRILIIEQGGTPRTPPSRHHTLEHVRNDFYKGGQEIAFSSWLPQFAQAAVLGGGSEVNSGLYHDLPEHLVNRFLDAAGLPLQKFLTSQDGVRSLLQISQMKVSVDDSPIARGAQGLGYEFQNIPRWRTYRDNSDFIQHGMIDVVWNRLSRQDNFYFMLNTRVKKIDAGKPDKIKVSCVDSIGQSVVFFAKNVIVAAGAIQTPRLLGQNGLIDWKMTNFQWHPMIRTIINTLETDLGLNDVDPFQAWTADRNFKFGSAVSTPGLLAMNLGRRPDAAELPRLRSVYASFVSTGRGGIIPQTSFPFYFPSVKDRENLEKARAFTENLIVSSGASFANPDQKIKKGVSTVHIFGTLPINSGAYIEGTSRLKVDSRIQVSDGSLLPFGPGVNPQGVIMSLCDAIVTC
jgi:hypothetical protein